MRFPSFSIYPISYLLLLTIISPVLAFNDDSRDDTRSAISNTLCENNQVLNDTPTLKSSCMGDIVYLQNHNAILIKNDKAISHFPVLDFKVSRNGKVYYRTRNSSFLSDESGKLNSLGGAVIIYLVSENGDVVYLNEQGIVFKNGKPLNQNQGRVLYQIREAPSIGQKTFSLRIWQ